MVKRTISELRKIGKHKEARSLVPATLLTFAVLDIVPHPGDIGYFYTERWIQNNKERLPPSKFWTYKVANYYAWDFLWYISLFGITTAYGKNLEQKVKIAGGAMAVGIVANFLFKQYHKNGQYSKRRAPALSCLAEMPVD